MKKRLSKTKGNILDFLTVGITLIAITVVVMAFFSSMNLMLKKLEISQTARKYILVMETTGCLSEEARTALTGELQQTGLQEIDFTGTTMQPVSYGEEVVLKIRGKLSGSRINTAEEIWNNSFVRQDYYVEEMRVSTAKN